MRRHVVGELLQHKVARRSVRELLPQTVACEQQELVVVRHRHDRRVWLGRHKVRLRGRHLVVAVAQRARDGQRTEHATAEHGTVERLDALTLLLVGSEVLLGQDHPFDLALGRSTPP